MAETETLAERARRIQAETAALKAEEQPWLDRAADILDSIQPQVDELAVIRDTIVTENAKRVLDGLLQRIGFAKTVLRGR